MLKVTIKEEDKVVIGYERYHHPHPHVQKKMEVLWLKSQGLKHKDICRVADVCPRTLRTHLLEYEKGGLDAIRQLNFHKPRSDLDDWRSSLEEHFRKHPPANATQAMAEIERLTGLRRSPERVRQFMRRMGMKCRKAGAMPAKADPDKQEEFKKNSWSRGWKKPNRASA